MPESNPDPGSARRMAKYSPREWWARSLPNLVKEIAPDGYPIAQIAERAGHLRGWRIFGPNPGLASFGRRRRADQLLVEQRLALRPADRDDLVALAQ
jgi:hypothetical protein